MVHYALRYAVRSLHRHRQRTVLTMASVGLAVAVSIVANRYSEALLAIWARGTVDHGVGHAQVHNRAYDRDRSVLAPQVLFAAESDVEATLRADTQVLAVSRRLGFEGIMSARGKTVYFLGRGVEPNSELEVCPLVFQGVELTGPFFTGSEKSGVLVGQGLAQSLGVNVGDDVTLMTQTLAGGQNGLPAVVEGIVDVPLPALSKRLVYIRLATAQAAVAASGRISELAVRLKPGVDVDAWVDQKSGTALGLGFNLRGWWQLEPLIRKVERIWRSILGVILGLLFVAAGISVLNIIFMLVSERTVEIGTLCALGASGRDIRHLIGLEACLIGVVGGAVGAIAGNAVVFAMQTIGIPFASPFSTDDIVVHPDLSAIATGAALLTAVVLCLLAALGPSRQASRVEPVVAFRGQLL